MTPERLSKFVRIKGMTRKLKENIADFEADILKLMAHPDTTPEQLAIVHEKYVDIKYRLDSLNEKLREWRVQL